MGAQGFTNQSKCTKHTRVKATKSRLSDGGGRGGGDLRIQLVLQTSACAPPLPEHELDEELQSVKIQRTPRKQRGQEIKWRWKRRKKGESFFLCYLKSVLSCLHPPPSASPYPPYPHFSPLSPPISPPLSSHSPSSSGPGSICDPDIHRRRRSSCV